MIESQLTTLGLLFLVAIIGGLIAARFKQPVVLGLLVIGAIIGPNMIGLVDNHEMIDIMVEFGAILFLFVMGLEFSLKKLMKMGLKSIVATSFKVGIMFFLAFVVVMLIGFSPVEAAFIGVALSFSSTMIIMNILKQKKMIKRKEVPLLISILVIEDIFGVVALTYFATMKQTGAAGLGAAMMHLVLSLAILVFVYVIMSRFADGIVEWLTKHAEEEIIPFISLGLCAGFAYLAFSLDLSPSAGAFLAGSVVSTFKDYKIFEHSIKPHSIMFTSFFFIAMGTMINFSAIIEYWYIILIFTVLIVLGLFLATGLITKIFAGFNSEGAIFSSLAMMPPGVFSLLVAREYMKFGTSIDIVSIVSILILILTIIMSLALKFTTKLNDRIDTKKPGIMASRINKLSNYISSFFDEIDVENANTFKFKRKARKTFMMMMYAILFLAVANKIIEIIELKGLTKYILLGAVIAISLVIIYFALQKGKEVLSLAVKILSGLEGGTKQERITKIVINLMKGTAISLIGFLSPIVIYTVNGKIWYLLISGLIILFGVFYLWRAMRLLTGVSMEHKYTVHTYKKINVKKSYYD